MFRRKLMLKEKLANLSPEEKQALANHLGISVRAIEHWKKGKRGTSKKRLALIANYFGWDERDFLAAELGKIENYNTQEQDGNSNLCHVSFGRPFKNHSEVLNQIREGLLRIEEMEPAFLSAKVLPKILEWTDEKRSMIMWT
jgi:transcriptional regulator with XRE-family HTH domain